MKKKNEDIGQRLNIARKAVGLTQKKMAANAGIAATYISNVENGLQNPSYDFLVKLARTYGLSIDWLLFGKGQMKMLPDDHYLNHLNDTQLQLLDKINGLPTEKQARLLQLVNDILDFPA